MALYVTCVITRPPSNERLSAGATMSHSAPHSEACWPQRRPLSATFAASHSALEPASVPMTAPDSQLVPAADEANRARQLRAEAAGIETRGTCVAYAPGRVGQAKRGSLAKTRARGQSAMPAGRRVCGRNRWHRTGLWRRVRPHRARRQAINRSRPRDYACYVKCRVTLGGRVKQHCYYVISYYVIG